VAGSRAYEIREYGDGYVRIAMVENEQRLRAGHTPTSSVFSKADPPDKYKEIALGGGLNRCCAAQTVHKSFISLCGPALKLRLSEYFFQEQDQGIPQTTGNSLRAPIKSHYRAQST